MVVRNPVILKRFIPKKSTQKHKHLKAFAHVSQSRVLGTNCAKNSASARSLSSVYQFHGQKALGGLCLHWKSLNQVLYKYSIVV